jgi:four helix bundle protein
MEVYRVALSFVRSASTIRNRLGAGRNALADQLDRASISIPLNIAEAAGELARREKARFYRMARRSATECAAILDIARELELAPEEQLREGPAFPLYAVRGGPPPLLPRLGTSETRGSGAARAEPRRSLLGSLPSAAAFR